MPSHSTNVLEYSILIYVTLNGYVFSFFKIHTIEFFTVTGIFLTLKISANSVHNQGQSNLSLKFIMLSLYTNAPNGFFPDSKGMHVIVIININDFDSYMMNKTARASISTSIAN